MMVRHCAPLLAAMVLASCSRDASEPANSIAAQAQPVQATDVAAMLTRAGLPVTAVTRVSSATDADQLLGKPGQYTSKALFSDGRHPHAGKSTIEVFASPADAMKRAEVVTSGAKNVAAIQQNQMVSGRAYVRLDEAMPAAEAEQYQKTFVGLGL